MKNYFYKSPGYFKNILSGNHQVLIPKKIHYVLFLFIFFSYSGFSQDNKIPITGTVTDSSGIGIPSVSVTEKGTRNSTATGASGAFSIKVYTQTTDVEGEVNGFMTYDRKVMKMPLEQLSEVNKSVISSQ